MDLSLYRSEQDAVRGTNPWWDSFAKVLTPFLQKFVIEHLVEVSGGGQAFVYFPSGWQKYNANPPQDGEKTFGEAGGTDDDQPQNANPQRRRVEIWGGTLPYCIYISRKWDDGPFDDPRRAPKAMGGSVIAEVYGPKSRFPVGVLKVLEFPRLIADRRRVNPGAYGEPFKDFGFTKRAVYDGPVLDTLSYLEQILQGADEHIDDLSANATVNPNH